jgi:hypothetical protein
MMISGLHRGGSSMMILGRAPPSFSWWQSKQCPGAEKAATFNTDTRTRGRCKILCNFGMHVALISMLCWTG